MARTLLTMVLAVTLLAPGCLLKEESHVLYLQPDGSATWRWTESHVRSDETDPAARDTEEQAYLTSAYDGAHPVVEIFASLGARQVRTHVDRDERPFAVSVEGRFPAIDELLQRLLDQLEMPGEVHVQTTGNLRTLVIRMRGADSVTVEPDRAGAAQRPLAEAAGLRILLTEGIFVDAKGFRLDADDTIATLIESPPDALDHADRGVEISLTWTIGPES